MGSKFKDSVKQWKKEGRLGMLDSKGMVIEIGMNVETEGRIRTVMRKLKASIDIDSSVDSWNICIHWVAPRHCTIIDLCDTLPQPTWRKVY